MQMKLLIAVTVLVLALANAVAAQQRAMRPEDLFRIERVASIAWSSDGSRQ